ncbi:hypothetical protein BH10ACI2_BH10ACI2_02590 [soil metagenome]
MFFRAFCGKFPKIFNHGSHGTTRKVKKKRIKNDFSDILECLRIREEKTYRLVGAFWAADADLHFNHFFDRDVWVLGFGTADEIAVDVEDAEFYDLFG